jgi:hypothetical protein
MTFDCLFFAHHFDVFVHLLVLSQYNTFTFYIKLWPTRSSKYLLNVKNANIFVSASV